jgi:hypothetical protein
MSGITLVHDFARKNVASAQRAKEKSGDALASLRALKTLTASSPIYESLVSGTALHRHRHFH